MRRGRRFAARYKTDAATGDRRFVRSRNLKPSLFTNELLAIEDPLYTVIFEGLWCAADRKGRLEDRPAKLHMKINPGRTYDGTVRSIDWLAEKKFILRYEVAGARYIQVIEFLKHQNPHSREVASVIPDPPKSTTQAVPIADGSTGSTNLGSADPPMECTSARLIPSSLIPDSGFLIPDSGTPSLRARGAFDPKSVPGLDLEAWAEWFAYRAERKPKLRGTSIAKAAKEMAKLGDRQQVAVDYSIANSYQGLIEPKLNGKHVQARNSAALMTDAKNRAKAIGFRDPWPQESAESYMTEVKFEENSPRPRSRISALADKMRIAK